MNTAGWRRRWPLITLGLLLVLWVYLATLQNLVSIWFTASTFNHCLLIPFISAFLIWELWPELKQQAPEYSGKGLLFVFLSSLLWFSGALTGIAFFEHLALVSMLIGVIWALIGDRLARYMLFPLAYLYFMVPEGEFLVPRLMEWTAWFSVWMLRLTGIPVLLEGMHIEIPNGSFRVAEACSGINYLIATLALATLFAYRAYVSWWRRLAFMALAIIVPLLANGLRAYGIIMIAHLSDMKYATGVDHIIYGWLFFGLVIAILFAIGSLFSEHLPFPRPLPEPTTQTPGVGVGTGLLLALLIAIPAGRLILLGLDRASPEVTPIALPGTIPGWQGPSQDGTDLGARYEAADQKFQVTYSQGDTRVGLQAVFYRRQAQGRELISMVNRVYDPKHWRLQSQATLEAGPLQANINEMVLQNRRGQRYLLWHWNDIHGRITLSRLQAKLYEARARLLFDKSGSAGISVYTPLSADQQPARDRLAGFIQAADLVRLVRH